MERLDDVFLQEMFVSSRELKEGSGVLNKRYELLDFILSRPLEEAKSILDAEIQIGNRQGTVAGILDDTRNFPDWSRTSLGRLWGKSQGVGDLIPEDIDCRRGKRFNPEEQWRIALCVWRDSPREHLLPWLSSKILIEEAWSFVNADKAIDFAQHCGFPEINLLVDFLRQKHDWELSFPEYRSLETTSPYQVVKPELRLEFFKRGIFPNLSIEIGSCPEDAFRLKPLAEKLEIDFNCLREMTAEICQEEEVGNLLGRDEEGLWFSPNFLQLLIEKKPLILAKAEEIAPSVFLTIEDLYREMESLKERLEEVKDDFDIEAILIEMFCISNQARKMSSGKKLQGGIIREGEKALIQLFNRHIGLIKSIANRFYYFLPFDDLFSFGKLGFLKAIESYNPNRGVVFSTFAYRYIEGFILRGINNQRAMIRIPTDKIQAIIRAKRKLAQLQASTGEVISVERFGKIIDLTKKETEEILRLMKIQDCFSLDDDDFWFEESGDSKLRPVEEEALTRITYQRLLVQLKEMSERGFLEQRERYIVLLRQDGWNAKEIADELYRLDICESRLIPKTIENIYKKAIEKIRSNLDIERQKW